MATVRDILDALEGVAPSRYAFSFDKIGLQVGDANQKVERAVVSLDRSLGAIDFAVREDAQLLLAHHPLIFTPLNTVDMRSHVGRTITRLIRQDISFIAAHTNWDSAKGGINDTLAQRFCLEGVRCFGSAADVRRLKLVVFCPEPDVQGVIDAASAAGAGVIGAYSRCAYMGQGFGTFEAGPGASPSVGEVGQREQVPELRLEMVLEESAMSRVERAVRRAHSYEEPVIEFVRLMDVSEQPAGRYGRLAERTSLSEFGQIVERELETRVWMWGDPDRPIQTVAIVGGAADSDWIQAQRAGADVLLTGEVKQHVALEAAESGFAMIAAGHYSTEHPGCEALRDRMERALPEIDWRMFVPPPGLHGRPL